MRFARSARKSFLSARFGSSVTSAPEQEWDVFSIFAALLLGTAASRMPSRIVMLHDPVNPDLPCPWCQGPTFEEDHNCPSCGQHFG